MYISNLLIKRFKYFIFLFPFFIAIFSGYSQAVPSADENIPYLVTFGKKAGINWGDDDFCQVFFFSVPAERKEPFYIRVFDPETFGKLDEFHGPANTKTKYSIYGGKGCHSQEDARNTNPVGNFKSGIFLKGREYGADKETDMKWVSFGPFNPTEGELIPELGGFIFKIIIEGIDGDDGNLYNMYLSSSPESNLKIEGGNSFTYEYSFRTFDAIGSVSHIYPFINSSIVAVKVNSFDFDQEGKIRIVSVAKKGEFSETSSDGKWKISTHKVSAEELNTSLDIQFIKTSKKNNNNIVVFITNQYGKTMPFYTAPIGGVPKFNYKIITKKK